MAGAGVLAVSSALEDYTVQPSKKQRRDEDPPGKSITNYFSPVSKSGDRGLPSPKHSNIANYFIRCSPAASKERTPNNQTPRSRSRGSPSSPLTGSPRPGGRMAKPGKRRLVRRLGDLAPACDDSGGRKPANSGIMGSDTAVLLAEICSQTGDLGNDGDDVVFQSETFTAGGTTRSPRRRVVRRPRVEAEQNNREPPTTDPKDQPSSGTSTISSGGQPSAYSSLEVLGDNSSHHTPTISFEDFMKIQDQSLSAPSPVDPSGLTEQLPSPKTVTVQAQVHLSPPQDSQNAAKIASIFKKNRADKKKVDTPPSEADQISPVVPKRKSNVVILEDDLELAVIDVEAGEPTRQRSTQAERQQFMKAFRQAGDAAKANTKKTPSRKKEPSEGMEDPPKLEAEEQPPYKAVNEDSKAEEPAKVQKLKRRRKNLPSASSAETPKSNERPQDKAEEPEKVQRLQRKKVGTPRSSKVRPPDTAEEPEKVQRLQRKEVGTPRSSKVRPPDTAEEPEKVQRLQRKEVGTPRSSKVRTPDKAEEPEKVQRLQRKEVGTPRSSKVRPPDKAEEPENVQRLQRKKQPSTQSLGTPESSNTAAAEGQPTDKAEEPVKAQKIKKRASTPRSETPKSPPEEEEPMSPVLPSPVLRRSLRRQMSTPSSKSPERTGSPVLMSTPKVPTPCQNADIYKAEVITVPSDTESPIRMRFTRVRRNHCRRGDSDGDCTTPGCRKVPQSAKKISKVKQILEKAKAIQQGLVKAETPQRRSTRQKSRVLQDFSVSVVTKSREKEEKTGNLRSLNDVLGKKVKTKIITAGPKREAKKKVERGAAGTEDGSESSDKSQDGEQFRARRAFLMSGLPESLRRQMARTSAAMEAYAASGASFQTIAHVQQRDGDTMWSLSSPSCHLLANLPPPSGRTPDISRLALSLGDFTSVNSESAIETRAAAVHRQPLLSDVSRCRLLAEIRSHNPQFPVRRFFKQFLKKQTDSQSESSLLTEKCLKAADETTQQEAGDETTQQEAGNGAKRKRKDSPCTKSKRRKPAASAGEDSSQCDSTARSRPSPACRKRVSEEPDVIVIEERSQPCPAEEDLSSEDVLWTEKYQPHSSTEIIGNSAAVQRLHSWLREWKVRAEKEEKRSRVQKMGKEKDDSWSTGDFHDSEDSDEDSLCNTLLITGPPGVGKTAAVYACAQELGFKVFEVNASCQRSGRQILAQLKEATQSHQVDQQGVHAHKPCFFSSPSTSRSPRKLNSPKTVVSSPRKSPRGPGHKSGPGHRSGLAPKSLNFFFKAAPKQKAEVKKTITELVKAPPSSDDGKASRAERGSGVEESQRRTATSLILFEEVDVIFDDDTGFLSAIKTFMSTTKRPVILTTSDPMFRMMFDGAFEDLSFHAPSVVNVASFLQVLCLAENLRTESKDVLTFLTANGCDVRASVLHLQFWARSGGARERLPAGSQMIETSDAFCTRTAESSATDEPTCHAGCAENLLGVDNIITPNDGLISFVKERILDPAHWDRILRLLAEFHSRNVYFTPSNLEFLLPLPVLVEEPIAPSEIPEPCPRPAADHLTEEADIQLSAAMRRRRKLTLLNDSDLFESDSNSLDEALAVRPAEPCAHSEVRGETALARPVRRALSSAERPAALLVCQCLDSMAEFADHMSFLDCSTYGTEDPAHTCRPTWTESRVKHGLCDGLRSDSRHWWSAQSGGDIRALVEALSFQKCSSKLQKSLASSLELCKRSGKDPSEDLTLRVTEARHQVYFGQPAASTGVVESRLSVVREVLSHRAFIGLGNRAVNVTEYLPALRHICRLQKAKEDGKSKRRFLHYLEGIHLELPKTTLSILAEDFP
ncbi:ATPase family AAA domain-containing protein 5 [Phyllobates terribilis]|uniref:ATPase family AAA domain-containing protein 5 n=1 Tax=Phyllobates terribilis TaxID=111132 RepID=UPI003CCA8802